MDFCLGVWERDHHQKLFSFENIGTMMGGRARLSIIRCFRCSADGWLGDPVPYMMSIILAQRVLLTTRVKDHYMNAN